LREAGVLFGPGVVDIDRLIMYAAPVPITDVAMAELDRRSDLEAVRNKRPDWGHNLSLTFEQWLASPFPRVWKISWWQDSDVDYAAAARTRAKEDYDKTTPAYIMNVAKDQAEEGDWLLCFNSFDSKVRAIDWMYVDFVVRVRPSEKGTYEKAYPFQAVQVHSLTRCPSPPFQLTAEVRTAFRSAALAYGIDKIEGTTSLKVPRRLLRGITDALGVR
jgi:hypothetical protein